MFSSVHVISKEKKAGRCKNWAHPPQNFLKANQVVKIAVKVTWKKIHARIPQSRCLQFYTGVNSLEKL